MKAAIFPIFSNKGLSDEIPTECPTLRMLHCVCCPKNGFRLQNEAENEMAENWHSFADDTEKQICYN